MIWPRNEAKGSELNAWIRLFIPFVFVMALASVARNLLTGSSGKGSLLALTAIILLILIFMQRNRTVDRDELCDEIGDKTYEEYRALFSNLYFEVSVRQQSEKDALDKLTAYSQSSGWTLLHHLALMAKSCRQSDQRADVLMWAAMFFPIATKNVKTLKAKKPYLMFPAGITPYEIMQGLPGIPDCEVLRVYRDVTKNKQTI